MSLRHEEIIDSINEALLSADGERVLRQCKFSGEAPVRWAKVVMRGVDSTPSSVVVSKVSPGTVMDEGNVSYCVQDYSDTNNRFPQTHMLVRTPEGDYTKILSGEHIYVTDPPIPLETQPLTPLMEGDEYHPLSLSVVSAMEQAISSVAQTIPDHRFVGVDAL